MNEHKPEERFWAKVDKSGDCWLWTAYCVKGGYGRFTISKTKYLAHRVSYAWYIGEIPEGFEVDHKCHTPSCVRPQHLQAVTGEVNRANKRPVTAKSNTGIKGISYRKTDGYYVVNLHRGGAPVYRGYFKDLEEAKSALEKVRNEHSNRR
jgi:hypothetical protein